MTHRAWQLHAAAAERGALKGWEVELVRQAGKGLSARDQEGIRQGSSGVRCRIQKALRPDRGHFPDEETEAWNRKSLIDS